MNRLQSLKNEIRIAAEGGIACAQSKVERRAITEARAHHDRNCKQLVLDVRYVCRYLSL